MYCSFLTVLDFSGLIAQKESCPSLKVLVLIENIEDSLKSKAEEVGVEILSFEELEALGRDSTDVPPAQVMSSKKSPVVITLW